MGIGGYLVRCWLLSLAWEGALLVPLVSGFFFPPLEVLVYLVELYALFFLTGFSGVE